MKYVWGQKAAGKPNMNEPPGTNKSIKYQNGVTNVAAQHAPIPENPESLISASKKKIHTNAVGQ
jgi:hypothetical protein